MFVDNIAKLCKRCAGLGRLFFGAGTSLDMRLDLYGHSIATLSARRMNGSFFQTCDAHQDRMTKGRSSSKEMRPTANHTPA
eukprot:7861506-Pyramimonas_sp.AAC.1